MRENRLRELRTERGLVQQALSIRSGVATSVITAIEKHGYWPSERVRDRLSLALGARIDEIWPVPVAA